jgi:hypothetical protein
LLSKLTFSGGFAKVTVGRRGDVSESTMKKATKRLVGGVALAAGAMGAIGALMMRGNNARRKRRTDRDAADIWARPGMTVVFRAELMPGRDGSERTFRVQELLPSGRVLLENFSGEHAEKEFERVR